jgi:hypothetical protein
VTLHYFCHVAVVLLRWYGAPAEGTGTSKSVQTHMHLVVGSSRVAGSVPKPNLPNPNPAPILPWNLAGWSSPDPYCTGSSQNPPVAGAGRNLASEPPPHCIGPGEGGRGRAAVRERRQRPSIGSSLLLPQDPVTAHSTLTPAGGSAHGHAVCVVSHPMGTAWGGTPAR